MLPETEVIESPFILQLSFKHIIYKLEDAVRSGLPEEMKSAKSLLSDLAPFPEFITGITDLDVIEKNATLLRRLLADYFPPALTHNEIKAVCIPFLSSIFNLSDRFKMLLNDAGQEFNFNIRDFDDHQFYVLSCCIIINEVYGRRLDFSKPLFYDIPTAEGVIKHYRILYNADFLDIYPTEKSIDLSPEDIDLLSNNYEDLALWKEKFPPDSWVLNGFAIMTLFDATVENAVSIFKEKLLDLNSADFQESITSVFRSIFRIPDLQIGYSIFSPEENKFIKTTLARRMQSFVLSDDDDPEIDILCQKSFKNLISGKRYFAISDTEEYLQNNPDSILIKNLIKKEIKSFILAPIIKNNVVLSVLEVVSYHPKELNSITARKLEVVMPLLTEKMERVAIEIENEIQAVIQDKFTSLHPSVNWKFREEVKKYLAQKLQGNPQPINEIVFNNVYPLYGQVDVKGSSDARNLSVQKDLTAQLDAISQLLTIIDQQATNLAFTEEKKEIEIFLKQLDQPFQANTEHFISEYLENFVHPKLKKINDVDLKSRVQHYFMDNDKETGLFHTYRRKYEKTISTINEKMATLLDTQQQNAQALFPHYYERFKSDGVEHNLYLGNSIAPFKSFDISKLYQLRLWQLRVICEMENAHYNIIPSLPYQLSVTSLILVYNTTIAIRFRMDEKRFDVDGSYNARFEIVKKRIDKACIKGTDFRITEPGKVTIVYSSPAEQVEYLNYINQMQTENILSSEIENFEIEDLQGVSGLKGIRATILH
jgi:hypothetical protein